MYHHVKERNARSIKIELIGDGLASRDNFDDRKKNADIPEKEGRFTKHVFKNFAHSQYKVTQHAYIIIKYMHQHVCTKMLLRAMENFIIK